MINIKGSKHYGSNRKVWFLILIKITKNKNKNNNYLSNNNNKNNYYYYNNNNISKIQITGNGRQG